MARHHLYFRNHSIVPHRQLILFGPAVEVRSQFVDPMLKTGLLRLALPVFEILCAAALLSDYLQILFFHEHFEACFPCKYAESIYC